MTKHSIDSRFAVAFLVVTMGVFLTLIYSSMTINKTVEVSKPSVGVACEGTPIRVDYPYYGGYIEDHACKEQCGTDQQRYILYSNGKATQCQPLPACNDWGEDNGITCIPQQ